MKTGCLVTSKFEWGLKGLSENEWLNIRRGDWCLILEVIRDDQNIKSNYDIGKYKHYYNDFNDLIDQYGCPLIVALFDNKIIIFLSLYSLECFEYENPDNIV